jgi:hypothetical protein
MVVVVFVWVGWVGPTPHKCMHRVTPGDALYGVAQMAGIG